MVYLEPALFPSLPKSGLINNYSPHQQVNPWGFIYPPVTLLRDLERYPGVFPVGEINQITFLHAHGVKAYLL